MKNFKTIFVLLVLSLAISCNDKDEEDTTLIGDVIIISKKSDDNTVYALAYYAYAYSYMKSVKVTGTDNPTSIDLTAIEGYGNYYFSKEPTEDDFSTTIPSEDTFTFDAEFETGSTNVAQDIITSEIVDPVTIDTCRYSVTNSRAEFSWTPLADADVYAIGILDDSGNTVFMSSAIENTYTNVYLEASASGWSTNHPANDQTYTVKIFAYKYEDSDNFDSANVQCSSYSQATLVWNKTQSL